MGKIDTLVAYSFTSDLTIHELIKKLNSDGPWSWMERDSDYYGLYISCLGGPDASRIKIFQEDGKYVLNIRYKNDNPEASTEWDALQVELLGKTLPSVGAENVKETEGYS